MRPYGIRRATKRWLGKAPAYVLACFDNNGKTADRYTVFFGTGCMFHVKRDGTIAKGGDRYANTYTMFLTMSHNPTDPLGVSNWGEIGAYDLRSYRDRARWPRH